MGLILLVEFLEGTGEKREILIEEVWAVHVREVHEGYSKKKEIVYYRKRGGRNEPFTICLSLVKSANVAMNDAMVELCWLNIMQVFSYPFNFRTI